jgi:methanogenic corrinoid protein MtbC1
MSTDDQPDDLRGHERDRPQTIGALANQVITVLRDRQGVTSNGVRSFVLDHLFRALLAKGRFNAAELLDQLRGYRLSMDTVVDLYIPEAAARLGEHWVEDQLNFAEVTIGALRLQSILSEAAGRLQPPFARDPSYLHAMIIVPQGEQHFLGANVLSTQLRRVGCDVVMSFDETLGMLSAKVLAEVPDLILITCGSEETVASVARTVQTIRNALHNTPPIALGGPVVADNKKKLAEQTGVDIVTQRAGEAVAHVAGQARRTLLS